MHVKSSVHPSHTPSLSLPRWKWGQPQGPHSCQTAVKRSADGQFLWLTRTEVCQETEGLVQGRRKNKASHGKETRHNAWHHCYLCRCSDSQLLLYVCNCTIVLSLRVQLQMNHYVHEQLTLFPTLSNTSIWKYCNMQLGMKIHSHLGMYVKLHKHHHPGLCTGNHPWECTQNDRILDVCMCVGHLLVPREMARGSYRFVCPPVLQELGTCLHA